MLVDQQYQPAQNAQPSAANRASATKQMGNMNRGSEFKKNAQQMLNR